MPVLRRADARDLDLLERMLRVYLRELAQFDDKLSATQDELSETPSDCTSLHTYWQDERRIALMICADGRPIGFALVNDWSASGRPVDWTIAEFFIEREFRQGGLGRAAAIQLLKDLPGQWEIAVLEANTPAQAFWRKTVHAFLGQAADEVRSHGRRWNGPILRFLSPPRIG